MFQAHPRKWCIARYHLMCWLLAVLACSRHCVLTRVACVGGGMVPVCRGAWGQLLNQAARSPVRQRGSVTVTTYSELRGRNTNPLYKARLSPPSPPKKNTPHLHDHGLLPKRFLTVHKNAFLLHAGIYGPAGLFTDSKTHVHLCVSST